MPPYNGPMPCSGARQIHVVISICWCYSQAAETVAASRADAAAAGRTRSAALSEADPAGPADADGF
jgi:hypothetical protein